MSISIYILFFLASLLLTLVLVPANIKLSHRLKLLDHPGKRSIHEKSIALAGGISLAFPVILLELLLAVLWRQYINQLLELATGSLLITILGFMDDRKQFTARYKLLFQVVIASMMYFFGYKMTLLTNPFGADISLNLLSYPFTVLWFLAVINAFNLIDGIDGLAAGIGAIVSLVLLTVSLLTGNEIISFINIIILGSCLGFLKYNFYPARIFMGDTGALFLGFSIAAVCIAGVGQFKGITAVTLLIPLSALGLPLMEILHTIFRRMKDRKHIFHADKEHIHHKLLELGLSQRLIALVLYFITFLFGLIAIGFSFLDKRFVLLVLLLLVFILVIIINILYNKEIKK